MSTALAIFTLLILPISVVINGLLLKVLWGWFVVPLGIQAIGIAHALGLATVCHLLVGTRYKADDTKATWGYMIGHVFLRPLIIWGIAAIYHAFM